MNKIARPRLRLPGSLRYRPIRLRLFRRRWQISLERALDPLEQRLGEGRVRVVALDLPQDELGPRLIVPVSNPQTAPRLARIAAAIAASPTMWVPRTHASPRRCGRCWNIRRPTS